MKYPIIWPQFFTATIQNWKPLLQDDDYKNIITECLNFLVNEKRIKLSAFAPIVIWVRNHVHLIWQPLEHYTITQVQKSFMTHTAKPIKLKLALQNPDVLEQLRVNKYDRKYQSR